MARAEETTPQKNWIAWAFDFFYPPAIAVLGVIIISRYFHLPIADDIGHELFSLLRNALIQAINWWHKLF